MSYDGLDLALWGLPLSYDEPVYDSNGLDVALWGLPMSMDLTEPGGYYLAGGF